MALAQKISDHLLTCSICFEIYKDPATLNCDHTFCKTCLVKFTKTKPSALKAKSIPCALCCQLTRVPDTSSTVEHWVDQLKTSFLCNSLMDTLGPGAEETISCGICQKRGEDVPASSWCTVCSESYCESCLVLHNLMPMSRDHEVDGLLGKSKVILKRQRIFCKTHNEVVKIFCKDCDQAICNTCCSISHRACLRVVPVESMMDEIKTVLTENKTKMSDRIQKAKSDLKEFQSLITSLKSSVEKSKVDIEEAGQKAVDVVRKKQNQMIKKVEDAAEISLDEYKKKSKSSEISLQMFQQMSDVIDQAIGSNSHNHLYEMYRSCKSGSLDLACDAKTDNPEENKACAVQFKVESDLTYLVSAMNKMMTLHTTYKGPTDASSTPTLLKEIDIQIPADKNTPNPMDVLVLNVSGFIVTVVTDTSNQCLKGFYKQDDKPQQSYLVLDAAPWSLAQTNTGQLVVTVPEKKQLVTVDVNPKLELVSKVRTGKQYSGIAVYGSGTFVVGSTTSSPPSVDILDTEGNILRSFVDSYISAPNFLSAVPGGNIYTSDSGMKAVVCLSSDGEIVFCYRPTREKSIRAGRRICIDDAGNVLFVDRDSNRVTHLKAEGQYVRHVLTAENGITKPVGVFVDKEQRLYVTERGKGIKCFEF